ncbi:MAG: hypothetical protein MMC33_004276 [Icmadophila ericetorum]|nr:hypothetical protein [Icmadophila ericetorum]
MRGSEWMLFCTCIKDVGFCVTHHAEPSWGKADMHCGSNASEEIAVLQVAVMASTASQFCVPCLVYVCVAMAGFVGLVAGSLYYGGAMLQSIWAVGRQRGRGLQEVALQGFKRAGADQKDVRSMEGRGGAGVDETNTMNSETETQRLIAHEREP